jgi:hypothetical protein
MTEEQKKTFARGLDHFNATTLHHGDCVGADADSHDIASAEGLCITIHPLRRMNSVPLSAKGAMKNGYLRATLPVTGAL